MFVFKKLSKYMFGSKNDKTVKELSLVIDKINLLEKDFEKFSESDFAKKTLEFKDRYKQGEKLDSMLPEAFAMVREAAKRKLGERHYDVQLIGGIVLHRGKITEMKTGEGKTLSSVTAAYLNALTGKGVHVVTVNDYLAGRDAAWMGDIYNLLGVSVGVISPEQDYDQKREAYSKDITYGTNNEFGFDFLRDNMARNLSQKVQRGHHYCIIDEIDSILIDEARTPLIISGQADDDTLKFLQVNNFVSIFKECEKDPKTGDYPLEDVNLVGDIKLDEKTKRVTFTNAGLIKLEDALLKHKIITDSVFSPENFEYTHYMTQALRAHLMFKRDVDYVIQDDKVEIVDEFTGRVLHGRRYSDGLHQAIEAKERIRVAKRNRTLATITFQNYFRLYEKISGMTGTAETESKEFAKIYGLEVVVIPTNKPIARVDYNDLIYFNEEYKIKAICKEVSELQKKGQPVLVGTASIEKSELLSKYFLKYGIRHEVLNAKNHQREAMIIAEAGAKGSVTIATNMAGRGTDIKLGGNPESRARKRVGTDASEQEYLKALDIEVEKWKQQYKEVKELGGLYILGTERHESRRIDNQLRGRAGRQGDPGSSRFYISMDDTLMRLFGGENLKSFIQRFGIANEEPIEHNLITKTIEKAQNKVEDRNYEIRKHLLEYDDVLNEQRKFIYSERDAILSDNNLSERVLNAGKELVEDFMDEFKSALGTKESNYSKLLNNIQNAFNISGEDINLNYSKLAEQDLEDRLLALIYENIKEKENLVSKENLNSFIRAVYLNKIDISWQRHLEELETLRESVNLRAYAQKNPLLEYKLEGFEIFDNLILEIKYEIAKNVIKMKISTEDREATNRPKVVSDFRATHSQVSQYAKGEPEDGRGQITVKRAGKKVGRNDTCPCGSGKKYKVCCGK